MSEVSRLDDQTFEGDDDLAVVTRQIAVALDRLEALTGGQAGRGYHPEQAEPKANGAVAVRTYLRARRMRERLLPPELFGEPAWDILLDLYASGLEGKSVSISSACIASAVPATTALRWLNKLMDRGLVERSGDASDARRAYVGLTAPGREAVGRWMASTFGETTAPLASKGG